MLQCKSCLNKFKQKDLVKFIRQMMYSDGSHVTMSAPVIFINTSLLRKLKQHPSKLFHRNLYTGCLKNEQCKP